MQESAKGEAEKRRLIRMLDTLGNGTVIVEGKHDVEVLGELGITAIKYSWIMNGKAVPAHGKTVYLSMDDDKGGEEKLSKATSALLGIDNEYRINSELPRKLLKMLNARCMEEILAPAEELIERGNNGKNLSRNSKVHG